jgi:mycoredoxin
MWYDIDHDNEARAFVEKTNQGQRRVPTIVFPDGSILVEPSDSELEKQLADGK